MYRVFLISLFNLINLCFNASGYHTDYSTNSNNEDGRHFDYNDNDVDDDQVPLMGMEYYTGGEGFRNEYLQNSQDRHPMQMAGPSGGFGGDSRDYGSDPSTKNNIVVLDSQDARNYKAELLAGNKADILDANPNYYQPDTYPDFGRRQFIDVTRTSKNVEADGPVPVWAPPEMVIAIAKESALLNAAEINNPTDDLIKKDILRTGKYWNAFWTEEVNPLSLREKNEKQLDTMKMEIRPTSELYDLIFKLKQLSPTLLYVINNTI